MKEDKQKDPLISISKKSFLEVTILLLVLLAVSVALTYILPRGVFGVLPDGQPDYLNYICRDDLGGIPLIKGIFAPVLVFFSGDGPMLTVLSVFLLIISGVFQTMKDTGGIRALVETVSDRFREKRILLLVITAFLFYCFGSFLGLFEEMLTMLPIVASLCIFAGYDSFTGFICSILACGFGFAGAITNPFTVLLASQIIGADPMRNIWFRIVILYIRKLKKDPGSSLTLEHDKIFRSASDISDDRERLSDLCRKKLVTGYSVFLAAALLLIIVSSVIPCLRDYTVIILIIYFLFFGIITGTVTSGSFGKTVRSFLYGLQSALPSIVFIALAASVNYVFDQGSILPTIINGCYSFIEGRSIISIALFIYLTVLILEFFISSSTAKAILVMGFLGMLHTGLSDRMLVLL